MRFIKSPFAAIEALSSAWRLVWSQSNKEKPLLKGKFTQFCNLNSQVSSILVFLLSLQLKGLTGVC